MSISFKKLLLFILAAITYQSSLFSSGRNIPGPSEYIHMASDTIPITDNFGDFLTDPNTNPFDIKSRNIEEVVEYDPETDSYLIYETIGGEYYRTPISMNFEEYLEWRSKQEERRYFEYLGGIGEEYKSKGRGIIDPISKIDIGGDLVDRLFGGTGVTIKPQGNIDLTFLPIDYTFIDDPNIPLRSQRRYNFDIDPVIQMSVDGGIGEKMDLGFNYNTQATFDFDREIKLAYDSEEYSEDDIIKKIEAGNVSLPLRSTLIQGSQELFGLKTELQFGKLRLTGIASQQKSTQESLQIQNGSQVEEFEIRPDEYDEFRHYFISHYHRDHFEEALSNLPYVNSPFRVNRLQVWVSDDRPDFAQNRNQIVSIADLGVGEEDRLIGNNFMLTNDQLYFDLNGDILPVNQTTDFYDQLKDDELTRINEGNLQTQYGLRRDQTEFETFKGRLLNPGEYDFNPELGILSLNLKLKPNQSLAVAYDFYYTIKCDTLFKVGELTLENLFSVENSEGETQSEPVLYTKMLKPQNQDISHPTWDLMMKNVYALRTNQLNEEDFKFDIFYEDDLGDGSLKKFLPEEDLRFLPLLNAFNLDRLNSVNDPQPDGIFDFVPGVTVIPRNGAIIFPILEPFGSGLEQFIDDPEIREFYSYQALYDESLTDAREQLEKNKFVMLGEYKSDESADVSLGAWNVPEGSVRVTVGSIELVEGVDYEVNYGTGRVTVINEAYLNSPDLRIDYEDNSSFSFQQKTILGLRADYALSKHANIGATYLRLFERPFTQKVNINDDPINNRIFGIDFDYSKESPWVTKMVDKLPFYSTNEPSNVLFTAEAAALKPGHSKAINVPSAGDDERDISGEGEGVVNIDDFEGAVSGLPLSTRANSWTLAATPITDESSSFPEGELVNNRANNANRAKLSWYVIDDASRVSNLDRTHPYTRRVNQDEIFDRDLPAGQLPNLFTFDLNYYPKERGPYNFDPPGGIDFVDSEGNMRSTAGSEYNPVTDQIELNEPDTRWGGITRYMNNSDFQAANYEFIDFWLLNPFLDNEEIGGEGHIAGEQGFIEIHLGSVSEDIINDDESFFENTLPVDGADYAVIETELGFATIEDPSNNAFDLEFRSLQDKGFDGMDDGQEATKFQDYLDNFPGLPELREDPAADNYVFFLNDEEFPEPDQVSLNLRYKRFNNPENNAPDGTQFERGNPFPDKEDLNNNFSLNESERYHRYQVAITEAAGGINEDETSYIKESTTDGQGNTWYRFQIPLDDIEAQQVNGIEGFRNIQYMRMLVRGFQTQKTLRLAEFELVRSQWRRLAPDCGGNDVGGINFSLDVVGKEENSNKRPFGYILPAGIVQERLFNTFSNVFQDEKSIAMRYEGLEDSCEVSMYKLTELDFRFYERLQMFVHAEQDTLIQNMEDGDVSLFVRIGKDWVDNYYEYEIPLTLSDTTDGFFNASDEVWHPDNFLDVKFDWFQEMKKQRNLNQTPNGERYAFDPLEIIDDTVKLPRNHNMYIKGNPTLGFVKSIQIGVRNVGRDSIREAYKGEVWVNELRAVGFKEQGGVAATARLDIQMADLGNVSVSGNYSSVGWGSLDQNLSERSLEEIIEYDAATNLELGKFFPNHWNLKIPFFAQYSKSISNPKFDPYTLDLTVDEAVDIAERTDPTVDPDNYATPEQVRVRARDVTTVKSINFTNVRKERSTGKRPETAGTKRGKGKKEDDAVSIDPKKDKGNKQRKPMPWDISNFSASYSYTETDHHDPILEIDNMKQYRLGLDYNYSPKSKGIYPFKKLVKKNSLKFIKEINFNPIPSSFSFSTDLNRIINTRRFRLPTVPIFEFDDRRFDWERRYNLQWDFMKNLKFTFSAENISFIDELRQIGIEADPADREWFDQNGLNRTVEVQNNEGFVRDYWRQNLMDWGRNTNYSHRFGINYTLPTKNIPILDWIDASANYKADFSWIAGALILIDDDFGPGAVIQNSQDRSGKVTLNMDKFYKKFDYFKKIEGKSSSASRRGSRSTTTPGAEETREKVKKERKIGGVEKFLVRPLLSLRKVKLNYSERFATTLPGWMTTPQLFGLGEGWSAPGWRFVTGHQYDLDANNTQNFLFESADKGWVNPSPIFNKPFTQSQRQDFSATIEIEPWNDLSVKLDFSKVYDRSLTEQFQSKSLDSSNPDFNQFGGIQNGSFEVTYWNIQTMFGTNELELYDRFLGFRQEISESLPNFEDADAGHSVDGTDYAAGYGKVSSETVIPAFLAAYSGTDPDNAELDLEGSIRKHTYIPRPNWTVSYDGLSKLDAFKDFVSSFVIEHGYSSTLRVNQFTTDPQYSQDVDPEFNPTLQEPPTYNNGNYFARLDIPSVLVNEEFSPLIGIKLITESDFEINARYRKSRQLDLKIVNAQLLESLEEAVDFGVGYIFKNVNLFGSKKRADEKARREKVIDRISDGIRIGGNEEEKQDEENAASDQDEGVKDTRGKELVFRLDFSIADQIQYRHAFDITSEQVRGQLAIRFLPSLEYEVNKNLSLRSFVEYSRTRPYVSRSFPTTNFQLGITFSFKLN